MNEKGDIIETPSGPHSLEPIIYSGKQYAKNYFNGVRNNRHIHRCPGVTTSRDLLINHCTYRKESGHIADDDFFLRVGAFTDVIGITYPLASFRIHSESTTSKLDSLVLELAQDYVFQACYNKANKTLLDDEDVPRLIQSTLRFINHSLFQSILYEKPDKIEEVIRLREQFETMLPSIIEFKQPAWAKLMWHLASNSGKKTIISKMYVLVLNNIINTRIFSRDAYQCKILRNCLLF